MVLCRVLHVVPHTGPYLVLQGPLSRVPQRTPTLAPLRCFRSPHTWGSCKYPIFDLVLTRGCFGDFIFWRVLRGSFLVICGCFRVYYSNLMVLQSTLYYHLWGCFRVHYSLIWWSASGVYCQQYIYYACMHACMHGCMMIWWLFRNFVQRSLSECHG